MLRQDARSAESRFAWIVQLTKTITDVPFAYATSEATSAQSPSAQARARCEARLAYDDEKTALEFLTKAFGLHEQTRMQGPDDSLMACYAVNPFCRFAKEVLMQLRLMAQVMLYHK